MRFPLYLDEDGMDCDLVRALRANGVEVITALEAGMVSRADEDHLAFASVQGRVLLSYNERDCYRIHTEVLTAGEWARLLRNWSVGSTKTTTRRTTYDAR